VRDGGVAATWPRRLPPLAGRRPPSLQSSGGRRRRTDERRIAIPSSSASASFLPTVCFSLFGELSPPRRLFEHLFSYLQRNIGEAKGKFFLAKGMECNLDQNVHGPGAVSSHMWPRLKSPFLHRVGSLFALAVGARRHPLTPARPVDAVESDFEASKRVSKEEEEEVEVPFDGR